MGSEHTADAIDSGNPRNAPAPDLTAALGGRFMIPAKEAAELRREHGLTEQQLLQALIEPAAALARPPISNFHVGAVGLGGSGAVYLGVNLEFPGLPLNNSVHAEQFLLSNVAWHGERALLRLAVSAAPCGHCRQLYSELACADELRISFGCPPAEYSLAQLLPQRFGPADLLTDAATPLLLQPQDNGVSLDSAADSTPVCGSCSRDGTAAAGTACRQHELLGWAAQAALWAANEAYSPYTHCPSGAAVVDASGGVHRGSYLESAAFNPGLPPLQAALTAAVRAGLPSYAQVKAVVLAELPDTPVQHSDMARLLLRRCAPKADLHVLPLQHTRPGCGAQQS